MRVLKWMKRTRGGGFGLAAAAHLPPAAFVGVATCHGQQSLAAAHPVFESVSGQGGGDGGQSGCPACHVIWWSEWLPLPSMRCVHASAASPGLDAPWMKLGTHVPLYSMRPSALV